MIALIGLCILFLIGSMIYEIYRNKEVVKEMEVSRIKRNLRIEKESKRQDEINRMKWNLQLKVNKIRKDLQILKGTLLQKNK